MKTEYIIIVICLVVILILLLELIRLKKDLQKIIEDEKAEIHSVFVKSEMEKLAQVKESSFERMEQEAVYRDIQLRTLVNQINPHFLYNTLESIRGQALISNALIVADMTETLSQFFRYCITQKGTVVSIEEEVKNITMYLKIINFRMAGRFDFQTIIEDSEVLEREIPKLTIQPIIENAIQHGLYNEKSGGVISLRIKRNDGCIQIYVHDNGIGIPQERLDQLNQEILCPHEKGKKQKTSGIALSNINQRIRLLYGEIYGVCVYSTEGVGTTVMVSIPDKER